MGPLSSVFSERSLEEVRANLNSAISGLRNQSVPLSERRRALRLAAMQGQTFLTRVTDSRTAVEIGGLVSQAETLAANPFSGGPTVSMFKTMTKAPDPVVEDITDAADVGADDAMGYGTDDIDDDLSWGEEPGFYEQHKTTIWVGGGVALAAAVGVYLYFKG